MTDYYRKVLHQMKTLERFSSRKECLHEKLTGHCYAVTELSEYYLAKYCLNLDAETAKNIAQNHDIGEYLTGDVDAGKVVHGLISVKEKERLEHEAWKELKLILPLSLYKTKHNYWLMFEEQKTKEAKFVKTVDALETMLFMAETGVEGFEKKKENDCGMDEKDYELSITYCDKKMQKFLEAMKEIKDNSGNLKGYLGELTAVKLRLKKIYEEVGAVWKKEYDYAL